MDTAKLAWKKTANAHPIVVEHDLLEQLSKKRLSLFTIELLELSTNDVAPGPDLAKGSTVWRAWSLRKGLCDR